LQGTNPLTGTTQGMSLFASYGTYVRVIVTAASGSGTGTIRGYGAKGTTASSSGGGNGGGVTIPLTTNLLAGDGSGGAADSGVAAASLVPYVGAIANVDLATHDLLTGTGNGGFGSDLRTGNVLPMTKLVAWGGNLVVGDPSVLGTESLTNGALTSGTSWTQTGDFALTTNAAVDTLSAGTGTIVQANGTLAVTLVNNRWYKLVYTVSAVTAGVALSLPAAICDTAFTCTFDSTAGVAKVFYWKSATGASALAFTITGTSTAGALTLDDLSLKEVQGGNAVVYGLITGGGTAGLKVTSRGDVGIGTTTPSLGIATAAGRTYLTLKGATSAGVFELAHGAADAAGNLIGQLAFTDPTNSQVDKRMASINVATSGGTANNRGSAVAFSTRPDGGTGPLTRLIIDLNGVVQVDAAGVLQQLPRTTDPTCAAVGDIGKFWFDNTTTTTAAKKCVNVAGTLTWVAF